MKNFMGKDGFQWFVGVVEDRQDPKTLGRVRVRCLGYHTEDLVKLPTKDLPWAHPMNPITSATVSGIGQTPLGVVEGTWVVGFFTDGPTAQQPVHHDHNEDQERSHHRFLHLRLLLPLLSFWSQHLSLPRLNDGRFGHI